MTREDLKSYKLLKINRSEHKRYDKRRFKEL